MRYVRFSNGESPSLKLLLVGTSYIIWGHKDHILALRSRAKEVSHFFSFLSLTLSTLWAKLTRPDQRSLQYFSRHIKSLSLFPDPVPGLPALVSCLQLTRQGWTQHRVSRDLSLAGACAIPDQGRPRTRRLLSYCQLINLRPQARSRDGGQGIWFYFDPDPIRDPVIVSKVAHLKIKI